MHASTIAVRARGTAAGTIAAWLCLGLIGTPAVCAAAPPDNYPTGGTIKGTVRIEGQLPKLEPPKITKDNDVCKNVPNESLIVSAEGGVQSAVIVLQGAPRQKSPTAAPFRPVFRLTNYQCRFDPHVSVMQADDDLEISNLDPILHTARATQSQVNVGLYPGRAVRSGIGAPVLGPIKVTCELHRWMLAYVYVTDNPYYAVTDIHGEYEIDNIPAGKYRLKVWHELLGTQVIPVEVAAGKTNELNFKLPSSQAAPR